MSFITLQSGTMLWRFAGAGFGVLVIFLSGFWLSHGGAPYGPVLFNTHKLVAVATVILLVLTVRQVHRIHALSTGAGIVAGLTALFVLGLIATGAILSIGKPLPDLAARVHHVLPYLAVAAGGATCVHLLQLIRSS